MLEIFNYFHQIDFAQLAAVYEQSILQQAEEAPLTYSVNEGYLQARQAFYDFLRYGFFQTADVLYAVLAHQGRYLAALRLEPYQDGMLIEGLETAPEERRKGHATSLVHAVIDYLRNTEYSILYSHVDKRNSESLKIHKTCGFERILEHAVFIDGSVRHDTCTLRLQIKQHG